MVNKQVDWGDSGKACMSGCAKFPGLILSADKSLKQHIWKVKRSVIETIIVKAPKLGMLKNKAGKHRKQNNQPHYQFPFSRVGRVLHREC